LDGISRLEFVARGALAIDQRVTRFAGVDQHRFVPPRR
jgi:hypothetical protein